MKILIAGDYGCRNRVETAILNNDVESLTKEVRPIIASCDYSIVNFEMPIVEDATAKPISKCGPNLKTSPVALDFVINAGFNCVSLANNHVRDYGDAGILDTTRNLDKHGIDYVGVGNNETEARRILCKKIKGDKIAIINCCENEFSLATKDLPGTNHMDPIALFYDIKNARLNADYVVVIIHGGHEHFQYPSLRMQNTYRFLIDSGADVVINHHQHCFSGFEIYKEKPIFYGLGNFCFDRPDKRAGIWNEGYMVVIDLSPNNVKFELVPYIQNNDKVGIHLIDDKTDFERKIKKINCVIANREELERINVEYYTESMNTISNIFNPVQNKYLRYLQRKHLYPSYKSSKWIAILRNYILCESHRDKVSFYLKYMNNEY